MNEHGVELVAGVTAGALTALALHPVDTVKVRFQAYEGSTGLRSGGPYSSSVALVRHVVRTEGALALYRGVVPATVASGLSWGLYLTLYNFYKPLLRLESASQGNVLAGVAAGASAVVIMNPLWLIKLRMQLDSEHRGGPIKSFISIIQHDGVRGLFRGLVPALLLTSNGAIQLAAYEELKGFSYRHRGSVSGTSDHLVMGAGSKIISTLITYPFQVAKTRMQRERVTGHPEYVRFVPALRYILEHEGVRGFYKGITANMIRSAPNSALIFAIYEAVKGRLQQVAYP